MTQTKDFKTTFLAIAVSALAFFSGCEALAATYSTTFPLAENPIYENGWWIGGKSNGLAWADFQSVPGLAFGKQLGTSQGVYDDSIALLTGTWGPNQTAQATVRTVNQNDNIFEELEIRLRSTITANSSTGYECNFSARSSSNAYVQIVRWNGPFGNFTLLDGRDGSNMALHNGDTIACTISGSTITAYINGAQKLQVVGWHILERKSWHRGISAKWIGSEWGLRIYELCCFGRSSTPAASPARHRYHFIERVVVQCERKCWKHRDFCVAVGWIKWRGGCQLFDEQWDRSRGQRLHDVDRDSFMGGRRCRQQNVWRAYRQ